MEKLKLKGRLYMDTIEANMGYKRVDNKGREYISLKVIEMNAPSSSGSTHLLLVDTYKDGKWEDKEPVFSWLEPIKPKATAQQPQSSGPTMTTMPSTADLPEENDGLPF